MKRIILPLLAIVFLATGLFVGTPVSADVQLQDAGVCSEAVLHYHRDAADYDGWGLHVWGETPLVSSVTWECNLGCATHAGKRR